MKFNCLSVFYKLQSWRVVLEFEFESSINIDQCFPSSLLLNTGIPDFSNQC